LNTMGHLTKTIGKKKTMLFEEKMGRKFECIDACQFANSFNEGGVSLLSNKS
jgi:hypothetical protein